MVRRARGFAVDLGLEYGLDFSVAIDPQQIRTELVADPDLVADRLEALYVEVRSGEVALVGRLIGDAEWHFLVRIVQEDGSEPLRRALIPVEAILVEIEHGVGRVSLRPEAIVGNDPEGSVIHLLDAGMTLDWLAAERILHAGRTAERLAFDRACGIDAAAGGELARRLKVSRRVGRRRDECLRRDDDVSFERRRKRFARESGAGCGEKRKDDKRGTAHEILPRMLALLFPPATCPRHEGWMTGH